MSALIEATGKKPLVTRAMWIAVAIVAVSRLMIQQQTHWEFDEYLFRMGVESFNPLRHHPHPPGFPLTIGLGQLFDIFTNDAFSALLALAFVSAVVGFLALMLAFRGITGDERIAIGGALLFFFSPGMLIHSVEPMSDPPAMMFLAIALWAATRIDDGDGWVALFAVACAASIGCRPQFLVPVIPMFLLVVALCRTWRARGIALAVFGAVCLAWMIPLVHATGGVEGFIRFERAQAAYVAAHDASLSRGARSWPAIVIRFVAHPWGPKGLATPVLTIASLGAIVLVRRRTFRTALPIALMAAIHIVFTITTMDPADGVRYSLPAHMATALLVALGLAAIASLARLDHAGEVLFGAIVVASWFYARPVFHPRATSLSPPVAAATWAVQHLPPGAVVVWDNSLRAHAESELRKWRVLSAEPALRMYFDRPEVPLVVYADGLTRVEGAQIFSWPASDAYGKLTRNHYRVVSLIPLSPDRRYLPIRGVNPWERDADRPEWRWLDQSASLRMPPWKGDLQLRFGLPKEVPYEATELSVFVDGVMVRQSGLKRGDQKMLVAPVPDDRYVDVRIESSQSFVPAAGQLARDPRRIAVVLLDVKRVDRSAPGGARIP